MSNIKSQSPAASQPGNVDPLVDSMLDLSGYDDAQYHSPSLSPSSSKTPFARPINTVQTTQASLLSTAQPLTGPSHQYDLYKQQTGIVPGALANTLQVNQNNAHIGAGYQQFDIDAYFAGMDDGFDFNASPSQPTIGGSEVDMDFDSPSAEQQNLYFAESTVNPSAIGGQEAHGLPSPPGMVNQSSVGRMWPGMHQQAALAKAQAQQRQQQQIIAQQQQQRANHHAKQQQQRPKAAQLTDPIVEQKITQLLNSMRAKPSAPMSDSNSPLMNLPRSRKEEDDMDEDERLLASEEGKKLSSKERRQLRNKVSARAFRSRRKEYITQLESEIAGKVTENGDLRAQNRALIDENKRLSDLTRMLLSSPSFSDFLERLSSNPAQLSQPTPRVEQARQPPKDVSTYGAQHMQRQQIGMTMMPEQNMDFSMLGGVDADVYNYQPQVYAVLETPEPQIDVSVLSGKTSNFVGESFEADDEKVDMPVIVRPAAVEEKPTAPNALEVPVAVDEDFENDPEFALYHNSSAASASAEDEAVDVDTEHLSQLGDIFGGVGSEKTLARYELVDATVEEEAAARSMDRLERLAANLEAVYTRLDILTADI